MKLCESVLSEAWGLSDRKGAGTIYKNGEEYGKCRIRQGIMTMLLVVQSLRCPVDF